MHILHICNDFAGSEVHSNLTRELDRLGISQTVYCPVREECFMGKNQFEGTHIQFVYSFCIRSWYKFVYHYKAYKLYKDLKSHVDLNKVDIIHAPTTFSDGLLAYKAHKEYGIPYVVAVRSTDIDEFIGRKLVHTWPLGKKIFLNASRIYFVSTAGLKHFQETSFGQDIWSKIEHKCEIRPNGIEEVWIKNICSAKSSSRIICYVGSFIERKNVARVAEAIGLLRQKKGYENLRFRIIGGGGDINDTIKKIIDAHPDYIEHLGKIFDKNKLMAAMRECMLFAMPSWNETFGLVYVEALSQGLPVIYSKNDGIDGFFDESVGIAVNPKSVEEISNAIQQIIDDFDKFGNQKVDFEIFKWNKIAIEYMDDYKQILK